MKEYDEINEQPMLLEIWSTVTRLPAECWQVFDDDVITEEYYDNIVTETTTQQLMDTNYDKLNANQWYHLADITDKRMKLIPDFATNPMNDKNARLYWEEAMEDSYQKISKVVRDNEKNQASGRYRTAKAIKDLMEVVKDPDFMEYIKQDASLMFSMSQTFASIPKPMFKKTEVVNGETVYVTGENGKPVYEVDLEKYDKLMSDYNFISMFEDKIKFCKEHTIPYVKAKKEGRLNEKMIADYKQAYSEHMAEQSRMAQEVTNINENDPLIKDNYTFNVDADLVQKRWKSAYAGNQIKRAHQDQIYLSNGWPVQDLAVLREIEDNYSKLEVIAEGGSKAQKAEAKAKIKLLKNDMKELRSAKVKSQVDRNKILKKFDELGENMDLERPLSA